MLLWGHPLSRYHIITIIHTAFCPLEATNTTWGSYVWPRTTAEGMTDFPCEYGGVNQGKVQRNCDDRGIWVDANFNQCFTYSNSLLRNISSVSVTQP